ncbi:penicillin-binding protein activator LpoB [Treponema parvum]|uniref:Penicillin-binding protein activator LpoB n=1 Tax=Treponema parvum TaxID=138851 RepID=A0A975EXP5_9SPIR|nr:CsgG/HfaB family protein [Treponema parvum]QTQ10925.1 penicillin-binding protein activator LpoB [Treponema parvum]
MRKVCFVFLSFCILCLIGCTSVKPDIEADRSALNSKAAGQATSYQGLKRKVAIARFSNETEYAKGAFYDKENDPLGKQAVDILSTKLAASGKFILLERSDMDKILNEINIEEDKSKFQKIGADYLIVGSITEYGRKNIGERNVFSRTKRQIVEAGVSLRLIDVSTGEIIYSEEGKGEAETEASTVLGFGASAGFDATLSDKAISAAISKLVENVINNCMDRPWKSYFLSADDNAVIISGGKSQGIKTGDIYAVYEKGKSVKNPQTGMLIELPGKKIGTVKVLSTQGSTATNEYSFVELENVRIDTSKLNQYEIREEDK